MTPIEQEIHNLSNNEWLNLFYECDSFWQTGIAAENSRLRSLASRYMEDNAMAMMHAASIVFRQGCHRLLQENRSLETELETRIETSEDY